MSLQSSDIFEVPFSNNFQSIHKNVVVFSGGGQHDPERSNRGKEDLHGEHERPGGC